MSVLWAHLLAARRQLEPQEFTFALFCGPTFHRLFTANKCFDSGQPSLLLIHDLSFFIRLFITKWSSPVAITKLQITFPVYIWCACFLSGLLPHCSSLSHSCIFYLSGFHINRMLAKQPWLFICEYFWAEWNRGLSQLAPDLLKTLCDLVLATSQEL